MSVGGQNSQRQSLVTTNPANPTTDMGALDATADVYGSSTLNEYIGAYADAAAQVRETLGIDATVRDLTGPVDDLVRTKIDELLLNPAQSQTQGAIDVANTPVDIGVDAVQSEIGYWTNCTELNPCEGCPPGYYCSYGGEQWDDLNEEEKRVCRKEPYDCKRIRDTAAAAGEQTIRWFNRNGHNDESDAFRHCFWSALMTKRANADFALRFGDAHEYGDRKQPTNERNMDLYNNSLGRELAQPNDDKTDNWLSTRCLQMVPNLSLIYCPCPRR